MNKQLCIFGAKGFAMEVYALAHNLLGWDVAAFIDKEAGGEMFGIQIQDDSFFDPSKHFATIAVGAPTLRKKIAEDIIKKHGDNVFAKLIAPNVVMLSPQTISIGKGVVICSGCILTCEIEIGDFFQQNLISSVGHESKIGNFVTISPGANINGKNIIGDNVYLGSNSSTVEDISIVSNTIIGASACVSKSITEPGTYVGVPARKIK